jgi:hypothetical protein
MSTRGEVWIINWAIPASAPANTPIIANIIRIQGQPAQQTVTTSSGEILTIEDLWTPASYTPDGNIQFVINNRPVNVNPDLNSMQQSLQNKYHLSPQLQIVDAKPLYLNLYLQAANGATAQTYYLYAKVSITSAMSE